MCSSDLATHCAPASTYANGIIWSPDMGKTWAQYDLKEFGPRSGCRIHRKNSDGWFRLDLRKGWIERAGLEANIARLGKSAYGAYLRRIANEPGMPGKSTGQV